MQRIPGCLNDDSVFDMFDGDKLSRGICSPFRQGKGDILMGCVEAGRWCGGGMVDGQAKDES